MQKLSPFMFLFFSCFALPVQADISLIFGLYTSDKPSDMVFKFSPVLQALEKDLQISLGEPVEIKMKVSKSYEEGVELLVAGEVDFSRFGPASYVTAKLQDPGLSVLALESVKGNKAFYGIIAVHTDSEIKTVADLDGKTFAFGSEKSTIGRYLSQLYLSDNGIKASDLSKYDYLGRHDKVGEAIAAQLFDAGALKDKIFKKLLIANKPLRELARFPNVSKPWIARNGLDPIVREALHSSLLNLTDKTALKRLKIAGFLDGNDTDYEVIRRSMDRNDDFFE